MTTVFPARSRATITLTDVGVVLGDKTVLSGINLSVSPGSRIAVVGENGRGKTTLLRVLAGDLAPDTGTVSRHGSIGFSEQEMHSDDGQTVGDLVSQTIAPSITALADLDRAGDAMAGGDPSAFEAYERALERAELLDAWGAERRVDVALAALGAETDRNRALATMSVGQRYRVRLACLVGGDSDFLILDEPTNHLDRSGIDFLTKKLKSWRGGIVLVSHDRALLADVATSFVDLDPTSDGKPRVFGGYDEYRLGHRAELARWEQEYAVQEVERERLENDLAAAQGRLVDSWRPVKGTDKHMRATRASSVVTAVKRRQALLEAHELSIPEPPVPLSFPRLRSSRIVRISAQGVSVGGRLNGPVSVEATRGTRLLVTGPNGSGKSTLLSVLVGHLDPNTGSVSRVGRIGFLPQETRLPAGRRAADLYDSNLASLESTGKLKSAIPLRGLGLLSPGEESKRVEHLSIGQQRRLHLALILSADPGILVLDEPTNHLSIALVDELTEALLDTPAGLVLSSHDRKLIRDVAGWDTLDIGADNSVEAGAMGSAPGGDMHSTDLGTRGT
ncbi:ABC-F family ATP-binding cassette domain-containing protein [Flaviflexus ciconiae]|uniref:ABC-F family ATP-binding cassette domain-containing protein n=1 Tax=Flaviflexus ciconiae TaxID=2496867 RepID=A0A3Q9G331_9ACTO|nr:ABC-F family ATP-binding cassette domain-containing protein [Flaviflexus ciconiae]AZQ76303.1 ABC-F family ATP-binding cassette domain-containing protein [Flaviflexus ciconiae]